MIINRTNQACTDTDYMKKNDYKQFTWQWEVAYRTLQNAIQFLSGPQSFDELF